MNLIKYEQENALKYKLKEDIVNYKNQDKTIVELTSDNVSKVEAMIATDSDYKETELGRLGLLYKKDGSIKYVGSSKYWFNQLRELVFSNAKITSSGYKYEKIIEYIVIAIDNENSTHLNSDKVGRRTTTERLLKLSKEKLVKLLKNENKKYELIQLLQTPTEKNEKNHFSFATKFCHYASLNLFENTEFEDSYSIYDMVLKNSLPLYIKKYLEKDADTKEYENDYLKYISYIDEIREKAKEKYGMKISRNGFDHLIWYYHKGK